MLKLKRPASNRVAPPAWGPDLEGARLVDVAVSEALLVGLAVTIYGASERRQLPPWMADGLVALSGGLFLLWWLPLLRQGGTEMLLVRAAQRLVPLVERIPLVGYVLALLISTFAYGYYRWAERQRFRTLVAFADRELVSQGFSPRNDLRAEEILERYGQGLQPSDRDQFRYWLRIRLREFYPEGETDGRP